jgi:N-formylglutamate amidohydrolase
VAKTGNKSGTPVYRLSLPAITQRSNDIYPEPTLPVATHVPHAGIKIPSAFRTQFMPDQQALWSEILRVTDCYTDELFSLPGIAKSQSPVNRIVLDLERYVDDNSWKIIFDAGNDAAEPPPDEVQAILDEEVNCS